MLINGDFFGHRDAKVSYSPGPPVSHPLPNFVLRLLDMPKLSLNLIIPLTSVLQPQFLLRHVILAQQRAWQENTEHCE